MHDSNTRRCAVCGREYQWEPHRYDGEYIPRYQLNACSPCYMGNWDGWNPHFESKLVPKQAHNQSAEAQFAPIEFEA